MAESPTQLLRQLVDEFRDLPQRLADQLQKQREMVLRGEIPGERREREEGEGERPEGGERQRDAQGRFLPGGGTSHQGAFARAAGIDQELLNAGKHLGFVAGGPFAKMAAQVQHAESLFNAIERFQKALAKFRETKEEAPAVSKLKVPESFNEQRREQSREDFEKRQRGLVPSGRPTRPAPPQARQRPKLLPAPKSTPAKPEPIAAPKPTAAKPETPAAPKSTPAKPEPIAAPKLPKEQHLPLPPFLKEEHLGLTPDQAARKAKDAAIAAGKNAIEVQDIGKRAFDFAHEHTTNRGAIHQRELLRAKGAGLSDEEASRAAHAAVERQRRPELPAAPRVEREASAGQEVRSGAEGAVSGLVEIEEPIEELTRAVRELAAEMKSERRGGEAGASGTASHPRGSRVQHAPNASLPTEGGGSDPDKNLDFARVLGNALKSGGGEALAAV